MFYMSTNSTKCTCTRLSISPTIKRTVIESEREFLSKLSPQALKGYQNLVLASKQSWGLCPACDHELLIMVLRW